MGGSLFRLQRRLKKCVLAHCSSLSFRTCEASAGIHLDLQICGRQTSRLPPVQTTHLDSARCDVPKHISPILNPLPQLRVVVFAPGWPTPRLRSGQAFQVGSSSHRNFALSASYQTHDHISAVVHSAGNLLASGADCADSLSDCMANFATVPIARHCGGRSNGASPRHLDVAIKSFGWACAVEGRAKTVAQCL
jgi:hypothetical protein